MSDKFEISLLEAGSLMQRGMITLAANVGKVTAVITLVVSALVLFTDIGFADFGTESFISTLAVMLISSYLMYFSIQLVLFVLFLLLVCYLCLCFQFYD